MNALMIYFAGNGQGFHDHDYVLLFLVIIFGSVAAIGNMTAKIAVQRDWAKALFEGNSEGLAKFNATMKAIDLSGLILSPVLVGLSMDFAGVGFTALLIPLVYLAAYPMEICLLQQVYDSNPALQDEREREVKSPEQTAADADKGNKIMCPGLRPQF